MVGSAVVRRLASEPVELLAADRGTLDLTRQADTEAWLNDNRPDVVIVAAARVGGIACNIAYPVDFLADNLAIELNLIRSAFAVGVRKLLFLGSSCIYPKLAPQPMPEEMLLTGALEPTNEWYAVAKIAGIKLVEAYRRQFGADFISLMPANLYGPGDNYYPEHSHVPAALIRRFMRPSSLDPRRSWSGEQAGRGANSSLLTISLTRACLSSRITRAISSSMSAPATTWRLRSLRAWWPTSWVIRVPSHSTRPAPMAHPRGFWT
jgi:nucleoside-diphosphate-sugar epimerase